jgi:hypothetical protein
MIGAEVETGGGVVNLWGLKGADRWSWFIRNFFGFLKGKAHLCELAHSASLNVRFLEFNLKTRKSLWKRFGLMICEAARVHHASSCRGWDLAVGAASIPSNDNSLMRQRHFAR